LAFYNTGEEYAVSGPREAQRDPEKQTLTGSSLKTFRVWAAVLSIVAVAAHAIDAQEHLTEW
jgi:hypothetical protein